MTPDQILTWDELWPWLAALAAIICLAAAILWAGRHYFDHNREHRAQTIGLHLEQEHLPPDWEQRLSAEIKRSLEADRGRHRRNG